MRKKLLRLSAQFLLFFFFFSSYLSAAHIHLEDCQDNSGCEICIVVKNFHNASLDTPAVSLESPCFWDPHFLDMSSTYTKQTHKGFFSTAPPHTSNYT